MTFKQFLLIFLLFSSSLYVRLFFEPLWEQDESAYAGFGLNILIQKDFLLPEFFVSEPHRKPPLLFYLIYSFYEIFGISEFSTRLVNFVIYIFLIPILFFFIKKYLNTKYQKIPILFLLVFYSIFIIQIYISIALTDFLLLFFQIIFIFSNFFYYKEKEIKIKLFYLILIFLSLSFGILTKGPAITITFWITNLFFYFLLLIKYKKILFKEIFILFVVFFLSLVPFLIWIYLLIKKGHQDFVIWFLDWYILKRTHSSVFGQTAPPGFYFFAFIILLLPWSLFAYKTIYKSFIFLKTKILFFLNRKKFLIKDHYLYEISLFISTYLFYEFLPSKLPSYILAFAVLVSIWIVRYLNKIKISFFKLFFFILIIMITIHIALIFTKNLRNTSIELAEKMNQYCTGNIYISNTIRLPGIYWYYLASFENIEVIQEKYQKIIPLGDFSKIKNINENDCLMIPNSEYSLLKNLVYPKNEYFYEGWIWDKAKKEKFVIAKF